MKSLDVLALGSCYVDMNAADYPIGHTGIPNETELVGSEYEVVAGGSAVNFCRLLATLGLNPAFIGIAGTDIVGNTLEQLLRQDGVEPKLIRDGRLQTNIGFNMTSTDGAHIMCIAGTANAALSPEEVLPKLQEVAPEVRALYLGGCFKLKTFSQAFQAVIAVAHDNGVKLFVDHGRIPEDASPEMLARVQGLVLHADYYLASRKEFTRMWDVDEVADGISLLYGRAPQLTIVVKDGPNGAYYAVNGEARHVPAAAVDTITNLTGAGDSTNAGIVAAVLAGHPLSDAVAYGCAVAAAKISGRAVPAL